jgi:hypothetical protein
VMAAGGCGLGSVRLGWSVVRASMLEERWEAESARHPTSAREVAANMKGRQVFRIWCKGSKRLLLFRCNC